MSILKVVRLGHPVIRGRARSVAIESVRGADFQRLVDDMVETMHDYDGVGLAAPQVHASIRLIVFEVSPSSHRPDAPVVPRTVLVNPSFAPVGEAKEDGWEGCLSIPDLRGVVPRFSRIRVEGWDREGREIAFEAQGFHARVIQHECDHIDGRVYLDRMRSLETLTHLAEFHRHALGR